MHKKAIIFDLDNTLYSVHTIGEELFASLFALIIQDGNHAQNIDKIKDDIMRRPFQLVAKEYRFSEEVIREVIALSTNLTWRGNIDSFEHYRLLKHLPDNKFLVT